MNLTKPRLSRADKGGLLLCVAVYGSLFGARLAGASWLLAALVAALMWVHVGVFLTRRLSSP